jgi:hypothetical protein
MTAHFGDMVAALGGRRRRGRAERPDAEPRYRMTILDRLSASFVFSRIENRQRDNPLVPRWRMRPGSSHREVLLSRGLPSQMPSIPFLLKGATTLDRARKNKGGS